ncbi:MAG: endolytic transglycosylase MltG [Actinomycetota bacterium]|nr:endolytic transglycosylase MltG [Actinomycetota bacterium]
MSNFQFGRDEATSKRRLTPLRVITVTLGILLLVAIGIAFTYYQRYQRAISGSRSGTPVTLTVANGDSYSALGDLLVKKGITSSKTYFSIYLKLNPPPVLLPGLYSMHTNESLKDVFATLKRGPNEFKVTVVPGMTLTQIATVVGKVPGHSDSKFLAAIKAGGFSSPFITSSTPSLEGLLAPQTYFVLPDESDHSVIQEMINQTTSNAQSAGLTPSTKLNGLDAYQILTVASLVQREALLYSDYPKVARVIYNRLQVPMNLQFDSTVLYGLGLTSGSPSLGQLKISTPYNTYINPGLPPTPISAPSPDAIKAALNPVPGPWLYFVTVQSNGLEAFSATYAEQLANEQLAAERGL